MDEPTIVEEATRSEGSYLAEINRCFSSGEFFRSYDLAAEAWQAFPGELRFAHRAVLSLANAGATELAVEKFLAFGLGSSRELDIRALWGRLKKDQAFCETGDRQTSLLNEAGAIYADVYEAERTARSSEAYYPGINAASLALLAGRPADAEALARQVLEMLVRRTAGWTRTDAADLYWMLATAIEANLILGDLEAAGKLIPEAIVASGMNYADLASTGRQLERILETKGLSLSTFAAFQPATILHYVGHIIASPGQSGRFLAEEEREIRTKIDKELDGIRIGAAYGSLAAGSDLLFAEALQVRGVAVNIVLPFCIEDMLEQSVQRAGQGWTQRFDACLRAANTVRYATEDRYLEDDHLFTYCSELAMGLALLFARHMHAPVRQLAVWDGEARSGVAGTVRDMVTWHNSGHPQSIIRCGNKAEADSLSAYAPVAVARGRRDTRAMLFGDVHGFSKLSDAQLPAFARTVMGALAKVLEAYAGELSFVNTWGDGIFAVFRDAAVAARCALEMQRAMAGIDLAASGLPDHLELRLGGHLGPVYELDDPVMKRLNYYGAHVSRAARIEPITPEGCVYVTETFAAVLALHNAQEFSCDYVGYTEMAKHYGRLRMFLLRPARRGSGPAVLKDFERESRSQDAA